MMIAIGLAAMILFGWRALDRRLRPRRSPLSMGLLRPAGYSLLKKIEALDSAANDDLLVVIVTPLILVALYSSQVADGKNSPTIFMVWLYIIGGIALVIFFATKLVRRLRKRREYGLGLDCELAVGQELSNLLRYGYYVFHDVPADGFNIDHVVVGPNGIFAIETKGRSKPFDPQGKVQWKVQYDGQALVFPSWRETKPLKQAKDQAQWLSRWLTKATGAAVSASPILALPGWYVERSARSEVMVFNGRTPEAVFPKIISGKRLGPEEVQRIVYQLDQRCRDMALTAYEYERKGRTSALGS
ncbi:MAG TPA: nuclease-related domain-containing protein [Nitrococcus sp.]|nr:nuclease-related domain-containing protein [Nitrococcus sp.]